MLAHCNYAPWSLWVCCRKYFRSRDAGLHTAHVQVQGNNHVVQLSVIYKVRWSCFPSVTSVFSSFYITWSFNPFIRYPALDYAYGTIYMEIYLRLWLNNIEIKMNVAFPFPVIIMYHSVCFKWPWISAKCIITVTNYNFGFLYMRYLSQLESAAVWSTAGDRQWARVIAHGRELLCHFMSFTACITARGPSPQ